MRSDFERARSASNVSLFTLPYLPYWLAGTYVVVEGWRRLRLTDPDVDELLDAAHLHLLRRFRDGVYHFHPEYHDEKFTRFWAQGRDAVEWTNRLWGAWNKFFIRWLEEAKLRKGIEP